MRVGMLTKIVTLLLVATGIAWSETFEWVDDRGGIHFTDDPSAIPLKYKRKARMVEPHVNTMPSAGADERTAQPAPPGQKQEDLYDGKTIGWWRDSYIALKQNEDELRKKITEMRDNYQIAHRKKNIFQRTTDRQALTLAKDQLAEAETALQESMKKRELLETEASKAGLPAGWREPPRY